MGIKHRTFAGGYRFKRFAGQPEQTLVDCSIQETVAIPLRGPPGVDLPALVKVGDPVKAGQVMARDDRNLSVPLLATVNGVVEEIRPTAWLGGKTKVVTIRSDGSPEWQPLAGHSADWKSLKQEALEELVYLSGTAALPEGGIPTRFNSSAVRPEKIEHVILQGTEAEVYNPSLQVLLDSWDIEDLAEGLAILARIMPKAQMHLAFSTGSRSLLERLAAAMGQAGMPQPQLYCVPSKYPQARPEVLVPTILGVEYPYGVTPVDLGVLVLDVQTVLLVHDAVTLGKPLVEKVVALGGPGFVRRPHLRVRIGTPVGRLLQEYVRMDGATRIVLNSAVSGPALTDPAIPVERNASALLAIPENREGGFLSFARPGFRQDSYSVTFIAGVLPFSKSCETNMHGEHRPCISCTFCDSVCPVGILPQVLHRYVQRNLIDETLARYRIFRCIDCNLCTYVCPSKIPLARLMREGKDKLRKEGLAPRGRKA